MILLRKLSVVVSIHCVDDGMKPTNNDNFLQMAKDAVRASAGKRKAEKEAEASAAVDTNDRENLPVTPSMRQYGRMDHQGCNPRKMYKYNFTQGSLQKCMKSTEKMYNVFVKDRTKGGLSAAEPPTGTQLMLLADLKVDVPRDATTKKLESKCTRAWAANVLATKGILKDVPLWVLRGLVGQYRVPVTDVVNVKSEILEKRLRALQNNEDAEEEVNAEDVAWCEDDSDPE
jgi:hypothetical protein